MNRRTLTLVPALLALVCALPAQTSTDRQRAALQKACSSGVLSPDECKAKLAALNAGSAPAQQPGQTQTQGGFGGGAQEFHDPKGRFTLTIPAGWQVQSDTDQLRITQGDTWAVFTTSTNTGQPLDIDHMLASQMQGQYTRWNVMNQGSYQTQHHHPAGGMTIDTVKNGRPAVMLLITQGAGSGHFLTMISSAPGTGGAINNELNSIFETVRFAGE